MTVFKVFFRDGAKPSVMSPKMQFAIVATDFPDFAAACEALATDQLVGGALLWSERDPDGPGVMRITRRVPLMFRGSTIERVEEPHYRYVDAVQDRVIGRA
jgi:hypothetical protein